MKISVDAAAGGALIGKSIQAAKALLKQMASNNYHWASDRITQQRSGGKYAVDIVTLLASQVDALAQRIERVGTSLTPGGPSGPSVGVYAICEACGVQGHTSSECYNGPSTIEHTNSVHNFNPPP